MLNAAVLIDAEPATSGADPNEVAPSKNSTVPVGTPPSDVTAAVSVADSPLTGATGSALNEAVVTALSTVWLYAAEVLFAKAARSADVNTEVIECTPTGNVDTASVAFPEPSTVATPNEVTPSKNSTEPVGIAVAGATGATAAVSVTDSLNSEGFGVLEVTVVVKPPDVTQTTDQADLPVDEVARVGGEHHVDRVRAGWIPFSTMEATPPDRADVSMNTPSTER